MILSAQPLFAQVPGQPETPARECDCHAQRITDSWCRASAVFLGTVTGADTVYARAEIDRIQQDNFDHIAVGFTVDHVFKGENTAIMQVLTGVDGRNCGFSFRVGEPFLVFAYEQDGVLATDRCTSTRSANSIGRVFSDSLDYIIQGGTYEIAGVQEPWCNREGDPNDTDRRGRGRTDDPDR
jgi:hypothetical protein